MRRPAIYGLLAEFDTPTQLVTATRKARAEGYRVMDAYSPFPIEELHEALHFHDRRLPLIVLIGGILGGLGGYLLEYWTSVMDYPINVGGRPLHSWPAFIPITFELTVLCAALTAFFAVFVLNKLPQPYHPVFNVGEFEHASQDRFFLCIEAIDPKFDPKNTRRFLDSLEPDRVVEVLP